MTEDLVNVVVCKNGVHPHLDTEAGRKELQEESFNDGLIYKIQYPRCKQQKVGKGNSKRKVQIQNEDKPEAV